MIVIQKEMAQPAASDEYDFTWILDESGGNTIIFNANHERVIQGVSDSLLFQYNSFPDPINGFSNVNVNLLIEDKFDVNGIKCKDSVKYTFPIEYYNGLYVPNSLSTRSGSKYDEWTYFLPKGKSLIQYSLTIFDKFGNMVFKTTKLDVSWVHLWRAWEAQEIYLYHRVHMYGKFKLYFRMVRSIWELDTVVIQMTLISS